MEYDNFDLAEMKKSFGEFFVVGFSGESLPSSFLDFVREERIGGLILFEENCPTHQAARELISEFKSVAAGNAFIAVDQEGGRVSRLRGAPAEIKAASKYGSDNHLVRFREDYSRSMIYLESLGFNINLGPVADIWTMESNECLRDRCFGETPERVAVFVSAAVEVCGSNGVLSCLKHFPGLGSASNDPHSSEAIADYDRVTWLQHERIPFEAGIQAGADLLMTTHLRLTNMDSTKVATTSSFVIEELARKDLQFDGTIITDDLTMGGASLIGSVGERAVAAFNAGHDLLLFGKDYELSMEAYDHFFEAFQRGEISPSRIQEALNRVKGLRLKIENAMVR